MPRDRRRRVLGRERELAQLTQLLEDGASLVTVFGPGGIGKTTLVRQLAEQARAAGRRVWWVDLQAAQTRDALVAALRRAACPDASPEEPTEALLDATWAEVGELWIILDNFEQLLPEASAVLAAWHDRAPEVAWLVTSRQTLRLSAEIVLELGPLALDEAAVALLTDRIGRLRPGWRPDSDDARALRRIAARLDGVPLALELAAARAGALSLEALATQLEQDLSMLDHGGLDLPDRHRTMDAAIGASVQRLSAAEREALWAASCFRSTFGASALAAVLDSPAGGLRFAHALRERALLAEPAPGLLAIYAPVHDYLRRCAPPPALAATFMARHASYVLAEADAGRLRIDDLAELLMRASRAACATDVDAQVQALRAASVLPLAALGSSEASALDVALAATIERAAALGIDPVWVARARAAKGELAWFRGRHAEASADLESAVALFPPGPDRLRALTTLARARFNDLRHGEARLAADEALALARALGDAAIEARALQVSGSVRASEGQHAEARAELEGALHLARRIGARELEAHVEGSIGVVLLHEGKLEPARQRLHHAALILLENNQARTLGLLSHYLGLTLFELGELSEATKWVDSALSCAERTGNGLHAATRTALLGAVRASRGHLEQAERCFADAEAKLVGTPPWAEVARVQRGHLHLSRARRARGAGDVGLAAQERTLAEGCLRVADGPTRASSDDLRIVARILERALLEDARGANVAGDAAGGQRVTRCRRHGSRRLVSKIRRAPGRW